MNPEPCLLSSIPDTASMPIGTSVVVATARNPRAVVHVKVDHGTWVIQNLPRARRANDHQVQWWLTYRPERTTVESPVGISL
jgi:hypothetical protein